MQNLNTSIHSLRADTPGTDHVIHLNNAGCALPTRQTLEAINEYQEREAREGGYEIMPDYAGKVQDLHVEIARMIGAQPIDIALTENASSSFNKALYALAWQPGDVILTSDLEYGNNFLNYLWLEKKYGVKTSVVPSQADGTVQMEEFRLRLSGKVKLIAVTHMPTNSGIIYDVEQVGQLAREYDIPYLVDACQTAGQLPLDVGRIGCDFLSATSRKYLRGPRGFGFLYVSPRIIPHLQPQWLDMHFATWTDSQHFDFIPQAKMFEQWEVSFANMMGLRAAVDYCNRLGADFIWERIDHLACYSRDRMKDLPFLTLHDHGSALGAIISFTSDRFDPKSLRDALIRHGINTSISPMASSYLDMHRKGLDMINRASVHYYNTEKEVDQFVNELVNLHA